MPTIQASMGNGFLEEFAFDKNEIERAKNMAPWLMPCIPTFMSASVMPVANWLRGQIPMH